MEIIKKHDKYLDPPALPNKAVCMKCGEVFDMGELNDDYLCKECDPKLEEEEE